MNYCKIAMPKIDIQTQKSHIKNFEQEHPKYVVFAATLKKILEKAADLYAPLGVVQTRAKSISSFSEKIIRKDKYIVPLEEVTDLCGARIICHFADQVDKICEFIRDNFEVDELNSLDVRSRLNVGEFGYRSVHYIVTPRQAKILGVDIPQELWSLKAEIQVRTFNEHIWADVFHDRIYKTPIEIPSEWKREAARLAAILENADNSFLKMSGVIDQLTINYLPTPNPGRFNNEKEILTTLIEIQKGINDKTAGTRLKLAQLLNLEGQWKEIIELLEPVQNESEKLFNKITKARVSYQLGFAMCNHHKNDYGGKEFEAGISFIEKAISLLENEDTKQDLAKAWFYLGKALKLKETRDEKAILDAFDEAHQQLCDSPYYYIDFLVQDLRYNEDASFDLDLVSSRLRKCITGCSEHVEAGIEVVQALFTIIKSSILLNDSNLALNTYVKLIEYVLHDLVVFSEDQVVENINDISTITERLATEKESIELLGHLLLWKKYNNEESLKILKATRKETPAIQEEVLVIAGGSLLNEKMMDLYDPYILELLRDFEGTVISGGTNTGIPGLVGNRSSRISMTGSKKFELLGYRPEKMPESIKAEPGYDHHITSQNGSFSFFDVMMYWLDILFAETKPENIMVAGFGGGAISLLEYKMGLAMDVKVALLQDTGGALTEIQHDNFWNKKANLLVVPDDHYTFWALANRNRKTVLTEEEVESLALQIHSFYLGLAELKKNNEEHYIAIKDWEWNKLNDKLKISNYNQAEFIEHMLKRVGLKILKSENPALFVIDEKFEGYHTLAQLEHARWNAERLLSGWKLGNKKDVDKKISPYIKRWELIHDDIKKYDYKAVEKFAEMLREVGFEILHD
jgi:ppGpp synthetase/RelA/SpoT-type nucleotidyltranferase